MNDRLNEILDEIAEKYFEFEDELQDEYVPYRVVGFLDVTVTDMRDGTSVQGRF